MSHLEERLEHDLNEIRDQIANMGSSVEQALDGAFRALHKGDEKLAFTTILSDLPINRLMRKIDRLCHSFIAVHLPSAGHLRLISSVIRANIILERIGDYAVTIARESVQLGEVPEGHMLKELEIISAEAMSVLNESISAFNSSNAERARDAAERAHDAAERARGHRHPHGHEHRAEQERPSGWFGLMSQPEERPPEREELLEL